MSRILLAVIIMAASSWGRAQAPGCVNPLVVSNDADSGCNSLRDAIDQANTAFCTFGAMAASPITFDTSRGPLVIQPRTPLPPLTCPSPGVTIDGYDPANGALLNTRSSGDGSTDAVIRVTLDGRLCVPTPPATTCDGLSAGTAGGDGSDGTDVVVTLRALAIHSFSGYGINVQQNGNTEISGTFIGTDASGTAIGLGNGLGGVHVLGELYGGDPSAPGERNLITGNNGPGVLVEAGALKMDIDSNLIGGTRDGAPGLSNAGDGVTIHGDPTSEFRGNLASNFIRYNRGRGVASDVPIGLSANTIWGNAKTALEYTSLLGAEFAPPMPRVDGWSFDGTWTTINVSADTPSNFGTTITDTYVEVFSNPQFALANVSSSNAEGKVYLGTVRMGMTGQRVAAQLVLGGSVNVAFPSATYSYETTDYTWTSAYSSPAKPPLGRPAAACSATSPCASPSRPGVRAVRP